MGGFPKLGVIPVLGVPIIRIIVIVHFGLYRGSLFWETTIQRLNGLGFKGYGVGFRVWGFTFVGFRVQGFLEGPRTQIIGFWGPTTVLLMVFGP